MTTLQLLMSARLSLNCMRDFAGTQQERSQWLHHLKAGLYLLLNITSGVGIVIANKAVFELLQFRFIYALAFCHAVMTMIGMSAMCAFGLFEFKRLRVISVLPLSAAFVGYVVFWNISLKMNPIGLYQLSKIMIIPTMVLLETLMFGKWPGKAEQAALALLSIGVGFATVTDPYVSTNLAGLGVSALAVGFTSMYQARLRLSCIACCSDCIFA